MGSAERLVVPGCEVVGGGHTVDAITMVDQLTPCVPLSASACRRINSSICASKSFSVSLAALSLWEDKLRHCVFMAEANFTFYT